MSFHSAQSSMSSSHSLFDTSRQHMYPMTLASRTHPLYQSYPQPTTSSTSSLASTSALVPAYSSNALQFVERYAPYSAAPGPLDTNNGSRAMPYIAPTSFNPYRPNEVKHRKRTSRIQLKVLEETFRNQTDKPDAALRQSLSQRLNMPPRNVQIWFQNRRAKEKKMRTAEVTASGQPSNEAAATMSMSDASPQPVSPTEVPSSENSAVQADGLNHVLSQFSFQSSSSSFVPQDYAPPTLKTDSLTQHRGSVPHIRHGLPMESLHQRSASSPTSLTSLNVPRPLTVQPVVQPLPRHLPQSSTYVFPPVYQSSTTQPQLAEAFSFDAPAQLTENQYSPSSRSLGSFASETSSTNGLGFFDAALQDGASQIPFLAEQRRTSSTESAQTVQAIGGGGANVTSYHQSSPLHDLSPYSGTFSSSASPPSGLSTSSQADVPVADYSYGYDAQQQYAVNGASKDSPIGYQPQVYDYATVNPNSETDMASMLAYRTYMLQHSDASGYGIAPNPAMNNTVSQLGLDMDYLYNTHQSGNNLGYGSRTYTACALGAF